jgi:hypothetical protein
MVPWELLMKAQCQAAQKRKKSSDYTKRKNEEGR